MITLPARILWGLYGWLLMALTVLAAALLVAVLPTLQLRRSAGRRAARTFFLLFGMPVHAIGMERLPQGACVVVANHASYLDGPLLFAVLPPRYGFVIKKEASRIPLVGRLLHRLGHQFVERFNRHEGASDARRILRWVADGNAVAFFPEGTFGAGDELARFHTGAFVTAVRAGVPVVPVVIRGARRALGAQQWWPRWARLEVEALAPLSLTGGEDAAGMLRDAARAAIAAALDKPAA